MMFGISFRKSLQRKIHYRATKSPKKSHFEVVLKELGNRRVLSLYPGLVRIKDKG